MFILRFRQTWHTINFLNANFCTNLRFVSVLLWIVLHVPAFLTEFWLKRVSLQHETTLQHMNSPHCWINTSLSLSLKDKKSLLHGYCIGLHLEILAFCVCRLWVYVRSSKSIHVFVWETFILFKKEKASK